MLKHRSRFAEGILVMVFLLSSFWLVNIVSPLFGAPAPSCDNVICHEVDFFWSCPGNWGMHFETPECSKCFGDSRFFCSSNPYESATCTNWQTIQRVALTDTGPQCDCYGTTLNVEAYSSTYGSFYFWGDVYRCTY